MIQSQKLSSLQIELLKVYSFQPDEEDLIAIRSYLADFFLKAYFQNRKICRRKRYYRKRPRKLAECINPV